MSFLVLLIFVVDRLSLIGEDSIEDAKRLFNAKDLAARHLHFQQVVDGVLGCARTATAYSIKLVKPAASNPIAASDKGATPGRQTTLGDNYETPGVSVVVANDAEELAAVPERVLRSAQKVTPHDVVNNLENSHLKAMPHKRTAQRSGKTAKYAKNNKNVILDWMRDQALPDFIEEVKNKDEEDFREYVAEDHGTTFGADLIEHARKMWDDDEGKNKQEEQEEKEEEEEEEEEEEDGVEDGVKGSGEKGEEEGEGRKKGEERLILLAQVGEKVGSKDAADDHSNLRRSKRQRID